MSLVVGSRLGPYEIVALIGAGGMGEVYRARDPKLNRHVALKILPAAFAADRERLARFRREAQLLASLSHPHIGHIYGLEDSEDVHALVLELIEGQTLAVVGGRGDLSVRLHQDIDALDPLGADDLAHGSRDLTVARAHIEQRARRADEVREHRRQAACPRRLDRHSVHAFCEAEEHLSLMVD